MDVRPAPGTGGGAEVPTCFRHPERETYLSCSRCGRPACPECLRSAPVGQQCVECIKEGGRTVRRPTAVFGGRGVSDAVVTYTLVALNVAFYLVEWVYPKIVDYLALIGGAYDPKIHEVIGVAQGEYYRLRFLAVYLLSALGGSVMFYLLAPVNELGLGASGAIFGLFGAFFVVARRLRVDSRSIVFLI